MSGWPVRRATAADLAALLDLYQHLNLDDPRVPEALAREPLRALLDSPLVHLLVAEQDGALRATCLLIVVPNLMRGARPFGLIENVVTHAAHRRGGWGRAVLRAALSAAWAAGCYKVTLVTGARDPAVLRFYGAAGFHATGHQVFEARPRDFA